MSVNTHNKAKQHQSPRSLDSLALAPFVHGFAIVAQNSQSQVCRCWQRYENKRDLMKFFLTVLISFFTLGCMPNKALLISQAEQGAPEDYCSDPSYRTCTFSGTYRQCLSEVRSYVSPCSRKSFPQNKANYSKSEFMIYHRNFSYCLLGMHISDKAEEGKLEPNPMCEERGFYSIHEKKK